MVKKSLGFISTFREEYKKLIAEKATITTVNTAEKISEDQLASSQIVRNGATQQEIVQEGTVTTEKIADTGATMGLAGAEGVATTTTFSLTAAVKALNVAIKSNPIGFIIGAITTLGFAIYKIGDALIETSEEIQEAATTAKNEIQDVYNTIEQKTNTFKDVGREYARLAQEVDYLGTAMQSQGLLSTDEYEEFLDLSNQLADIFPQLRKGYDDNGNAILDLSGDFDTITGSLTELLKVEQDLANQEIIDKMPDVYKGYIDNIENYERELDNLKAREMAIDQLRKSNYTDMEKESGELRFEFNWGNISDDAAIAAENAILNVLDDVGLVDIVTQSSIDFSNGDKLLDIVFNDEESVDKFKNIGNIIGDQYQNILDQIQTQETKIKQENASFGKYINTWLEGQWLYANADPIMQNVVQESLLNTDWKSALTEAGVDTSNWEEVSKWLEINLLASIDDIDDKQIKDKMAQLLSGENFENIESVYREIINYLLGLDGFNENNPLVIYYKTQIEDYKDKRRKVAAHLSDSGLEQDEFYEHYDELSNKQIDKILSLSIPKGTIRTWDQLLDLIKDVKEESSDLFNEEHLKKTNDALKSVNSLYNTLIENINDKKSGYDLAFDIDDIDELKVYKDSDGDEKELLFDEVGLEKFNAYKKILTEGTASAEEMKDALNGMSTLIADTILEQEDYSEESQQLVKAQLYEAGITKESAEAYVDYKTALHESESEKEKLKNDWNNKNPDNDSYLKDLSNELNAYYELKEGMQEAYESREKVFNTTYDPQNGLEKEIEDVNELESAYEDLKDIKVSVDENGYIGNIDINNRPIVINGDGSYNTTLTDVKTRDLGNGEAAVFRVTPILPNGVELTDDELEKYIDDLVSKSNGDTNKMMELDSTSNGGKGLIFGIDTEINGEPITSENIDEAIEYAQNWNYVQHLLQAGIYEEAGSYAIDINCEVKYDSLEKIKDEIQEKIDSGDIDEDVGIEIQAAIDLAQNGGSGYDEVVNLINQKIQDGVIDKVEGEQFIASINVLAEQNPNAFTIIDNNIQKLIEEGKVAEDSAESLRNFLYAEEIANGTALNTASDCIALQNLAEDGNVTTEVISYLIRLMEIYDGLEAGVYGQGTEDRARAMAEAEELKNKIANLVNGLNADGTSKVKVEVEPTLDNRETKDNISKSGKDSGDTYVEAFEDSVKKLDELKDKGLISDREYLERYRQLIEAFFKDVDGYAEQYRDYMQDYNKKVLDYMDSVVSGITKLIDRKINAANDNKDDIIDALNKEKDAAIEAYEDQIDALDDLIDKKNDQIDAIQDEIDKINDAADAREREINLQKAQYELERMESQRTRLIYQNGQMVYQNDSSEIRDKKEEVGDAQREIEIAALEKKIELIEKEVDSLEKEKEAIEKQKEETEKYYDKLIEEQEKYWDSIIKGLEDQKKKWEELLEIREIAEAYALVSGEMEKFGFTVEDVLNDTPGAFEKFSEAYLDALTGTSAGNEDFISGINYAVSSAQTELNKLSGYATQAGQDFIDGWNSANIEDTINKTLIGLFDKSKNGLPEELKTIATTAANSIPEGIKETLDADTTAEEAAKNLGQRVVGVDEPHTGVAEGIGMGSPSEKAGEAADSIPEGIVQHLDADTTAEESAQRLGERIINSLKDSFENGDFTESISQLASAISGEDGNEGLSNAINGLNDISLGSESEGIIGQFNALTEAITDTTNAIDGSGGQGGEMSLSGSSKGGNGNKSDSKSGEKGEGSGEGGTLVDALTNMQTIGSQATSELIGTEETGFKGIDSKVNKTTEDIGEQSDEGAETLNGSINELGKTTGEVMPEVISQFSELSGLIASAAASLSKLVSDLKNIENGEISISGFSKGAFTGTAYANGNWSAKSKGIDGESLVGELGTEIIVDSRTGEWYTVGNNGAEFVNVKPNDIVFNHKQSEELLKNGKINSRGKAFANGQLPSNLVPISGNNMYKNLIGQVDNIVDKLTFGNDKLTMLTKNIENITMRNNSVNNNPVINVNNPSFTCTGVTGEEVLHQIEHSFEGLFVNAYQRSKMK